MTDEDLDPKVQAEIKRHVRRARQILREDKILAMHAESRAGDDADPETEDPPEDAGKPKAPKRQAPAAPEPKAHPWWGKATP